MKSIVITISLFLVTILAVSSVSSGSNTPEAERPGGDIPTQPNQASILYLPTMSNLIPPVVDVPVLSVSYLPPDASDPALLDASETGLPSGTTIAAIQQHVTNSARHGASLISEATAYRGYRDPNAPAYLRYRVEHAVEYLEPLPPGYQLAALVSEDERRKSSTYSVTLASGHELQFSAATFYPHYRQILDRLNVCDYVDRLGVKEVWLFGYHSDRIAPAESKMSSRYGDISNSIRDETLPAQFRLPRCTHAYVLYNFNYSRGVETNIHNRMHQIESVIGHIDTSGQLFWDDFSEFVVADTTHDYLSSCGNAHYTPNWSNAQAHAYRYSLYDFRQNNCETWHPDDDRTTYVNQNCAQWGCTEIGFYQWFMQNMPGYENGIVHQGCVMRNWWDAMLDFNAFMDEGRTLYACP